MPRFVQLRTNEALSNRRHKSVLLKAAEQRLRPRLIAAAVAVLACASLAWWHQSSAPRPAPFARDTERIVADVDWSEDACPRTYVYALPRTLSDWAPGDASPDDGVDANANLLEVLVEALQKRCSTKSPADAELFLIPVLPRAKHWSDWMRRCDKLAKLGARDWRRRCPLTWRRRAPFCVSSRGLRAALRGLVGRAAGRARVRRGRARERRRCAYGVHRRLDGVTGTPSPRPHARNARRPRRLRGVRRRLPAQTSASARQRAHPGARPAPRVGALRGTTLWWNARRRDGRYLGPRRRRAGERQEPAPGAAAGLRRFK